MLLRRHESNSFLTTHDPQPILTGCKALVLSAPKPMRGEEEERIKRDKNFIGFPHQALAF
jgi:hypothetical protein